MAYVSHNSAVNLEAAVDVTLNVGTGSGRKAIAYHVHQNYGSTEQGTAVRDPSGADQAMTNIRHEDVLLSMDSYFMLDAYYLDLDGIEGTQTFRFDATGRVRTAACVLVWDELEAGAPEASAATEFTTTTDTISNAVTTVTNGAVIFTGAFFRPAASATAPWWTANNGQTKRVDIVSDELVSLVAGDLVAGSAGSQTVGWTGDANGSVGIQILAAFEAASGGDPTEPTLTSPTATATGQTTASLSVTVDSTADVYTVVTTSATAPTDTQVMAGQDHTGAAAAFADDDEDAEAGSVPFTATGLAPDTTYYAHFVADNEDGTSDVVTSSSFTTDFAGIEGTVTLEASPVEGVRIYAIDTTSYATETTLTDESGEYQLELDPGTYDVFFRWIDTNDDDTPYTDAVLDVEVE